MNEAVSARPNRVPSKVYQIGGLVLGGTIMAVLTVAWAAFLVWLVAEGVMTVLHWLRP